MHYNICLLFYSLFYNKTKNYIKYLKVLQKELVYYIISLVYNLSLSYLQKKGFMIAVYFLEIKHCYANHTNCAKYNGYLFLN